MSSPSMGHEESPFTIDDTEWMTPNTPLHDLPLASDGEDRGLDDKESAVQDAWLQMDDASLLHDEEACLQADREEIAAEKRGSFGSLVILMFLLVTMVHVATLYGAHVISARSHTTVVTADTYQSSTRSQVFHSGMEADVTETHTAKDGDTVRVSIGPHVVFGDDSTPEVTLQFEYPAKPRKIPKATIWPFADCGGREDPSFSTDIIVPHGKETTLANGAVDYDLGIDIDTSKVAGSVFWDQLEDNVEVAYVGFCVRLDLEVGGVSVWFLETRLKITVDFTKEFLATLFLDGASSREEEEAEEEGTPRERDHIS